MRWYRGGIVARSPLPVTRLIEAWATGDALPRSPATTATATTAASAETATAAARR
jgi:hypothetical protein